ncbi:MAG TPA: DUF362 domain-containing protein [Syntrophorhabdaceae bacterium]|nr:DUF362 domain-containing protein [Syntrophorhabdaceae bacterium]
MERRDFLKLALSSFVVSQIPKKLFAKDPSLVAVSEGQDYAAITRKVIAAVGGMPLFVKKGDMVVVKPNMGWDRKPEFAATTHPIVVKTIVEECLKAGAHKVKIFDNPCNDPRRCYENSGILDALKGMNDVEVKQMDRERYKKTKLNGVFLKEWDIYDEALSAKVFINVPIAKHHDLTRLTLGLKNMMGILAEDRGYLHRGIDQALSDVSSVVKSHLTIVDATRILLHHGPQGGSLRDVRVANTVIASTDIVAADAYATTLFDLKPEDISTTVAAYKRGLGDMNLSKVRIVKV